MKLLTVPARQGLHWVRAGFRVLAAAPLAYTTLYFIVLIGFSLLQGLPWIGPALAALLLPTVTVGLVLASEVIEAGRIPAPTILLRALRRSPATAASMLQLGVVVLATSLGTQLLADWMDPDFADRLLQWSRAAQHAADAADTVDPDSGLALGMLLRLALLTPVSLLLWHAPTLLDRSRGTLGVGKAIFASALACWRNKGAFTVYALAWLMLMGGTTVAALAFFMLLGRPELAFLAWVPASFILSTAMCASVYFTVVDCFDFSDPAASVPPQP